MPDQSDSLHAMCPTIAHAAAVCQGVKDGFCWTCTGMLEKVRLLLTSDPDPMVVSNCMSVIVKVLGMQPAL